MVCVVCNEVTTEGDMETPVILMFETKAEAVAWVKNDVASEREILDDDGLEPSRDKGQLNEDDSQPWWQLDVDFSSGKYGEYYTRMTTWDVVEPWQVSVSWP